MTKKETPAVEAAKNLRRAVKVISVRERSDAVCEHWGISRYRLAQLLRIESNTLKQETEGSQLLHWALLRIEEEGLKYFKRKEKELGIFGRKNM